MPGRTCPLKTHLIVPPGRCPTTQLLDNMNEDAAALVLAFATENAELRAALAEAQELLIETAVDAGEMHARLEEVQRELVVVRMDHDA